MCLISRLGTFSDAVNVIYFHFAHGIQISLCRLKKSGIRVGHRLLELISIKKRPFQREVTVLGILQFISGTVWTYLFGKNADALEKNTEQANACE